MEKHIAKQKILTEISKRVNGSCISVKEFSEMLELDYNDVYSYCNELKKESFIIAQHDGSGLIADYLMSNCSLGISFLNDGGFIKRYELEQIEIKKKKKGMKGLLLRKLYY